MLDCSLCPVGYYAEASPKIILHFLSHNLEGGHSSGLELDGDAFMYGHCLLVWWIRMLGSVLAMLSEWPALGAALREDCFCFFNEYVSWKVGLFIGLFSIPDGAVSLDPRDWRQ